MPKTKPKWEEKLGKLKLDGITIDSISKCFEMLLADYQQELREKVKMFGKAQLSNGEILISLDEVLNLLTPKN